MVTIPKYILPLCALGVILSVSCNALIFGSSSYEKVNQARATEQTNFEDSTNVFFTVYTNPYKDKEFLWFAVFGEGLVEMHVYDVETDSLQYVYHFEKQDGPVYAVALHEDREHFVKCVLVVDGHKKCAKLYPAWIPLQIPQFRTKYAIETK